MIPEARRQHRRWMLHAGTFLIGALIPVGLIAWFINSKFFDLHPHGGPLIPWAVFVAGLALVALVGIGLVVGKLVLASRYDPNSDDSEARKQLGRSRAMLREEFDQQAEPGTENKT
jgi:hypothetical protein